MTLPILKSEITNFAGGIKKRHDDTLILIDDLHLQSNFKVDMLEYFRMWTKNRGHYNVQGKGFDSLCNLKTLMTFDLKYGLQSMKSLKNIDISQNRYTFYCHQIYIPPIQRNKMRKILQGVVSYRLDSLYDHPLNRLSVPLIQSLMGIDEYFKKNVARLKYSQFNNPNNIFNKKRLIETVLTRALDKEEEIDTPQAVAEVVLSLTNQFYLLRILEPSIKLVMYEDIGAIIMNEFNLHPKDLGEKGLKKKDLDNLNKVVQEQIKRKNGKETKNSSIMSMESMNECRRLLEQIECGIKHHLIVSPDVVPIEEIVKHTCEIGGYSYFPVFNSKLVSRYFDSYEFKVAIQSSIKAHKKGINKKVVVYISDTHHSDIVYADLLNLIISFPEEKCIFKEKQFIDRL